MKYETNFFIKYVRTKKKNSDFKKDSFYSLCRHKNNGLDFCVKPFFCVFSYIRCKKNISRGYEPFLVYVLNYNKLSGATHLWVLQE